MTKSEVATRMQEARIAARQSVARETDDAIYLPHYTRRALEQMGDQRASGAHTAYRQAFAQAFADAWWARYHVIAAQRDAPAPPDDEPKTFKKIGA